MVGPMFAFSSPMADLRLFITRNREYMIQDEVCVGVRDRRTGAWLHHSAVTQRASMVRSHGGRVVAHPLSARVGSSLYFPAGPVVTSKVRQVRNASRQTTTDLAAIA